MAVPGEGFSSVARSTSRTPYGNHPASWPRPEGEEGYREVGATGTEAYI